MRGLTWVWLMPSRSYSTGSSTVMMLSVWSSSRDSAAYSVVVLPEPVGPVTSTMPCGWWIRRSSSCQRVRAHAEPLQLQPPGLLVEQAQHHALAVAGGQGGDAHVHRPAAEAQRDAAVLRQAFFGDVELRHDLDARHHRGVQRALRLDHVAQHAVDAEAHHRARFEGFDVDVRGAVAQRLGEQRR